MEEVTEEALAVEEACGGSFGSDAIPRTMPLRKNEELFSDNPGVMPGSRDCGEPWEALQIAGRVHQVWKRLNVPAATKMKD